MTTALKWRIAVGLLLVFLAGVATGVFAGAWHARDAFAGRHGPRMGDRMRERLVRELELTPEQVRQMSPILDDTARRLQEIRRESGGRVNEVLTQSHQQLGAYLTPDQKDRWEDMQRRHRRFWRRHRGEPPPPDRP
jgi:Spy/CpxP family protein refolding chaperone